MHRSLKRTTGRKPEGWLGPYLAQSATTLDLLKEAGYSYVMDWPADDQPFWMSTRSGPILSVPYPLEMNDSPALIFRQHSAREFGDMIVDQFDEMLQQSKKRPLVFASSLHPFIVGQPFRLRAFRRAMDHIMRRNGRTVDYDTGRGRQVLPRRCPKTCCRSRPAKA